MESTRQSELIDRTGLITVDAMYQKRDRVLAAARAAGCPLEFQDWLQCNWAIWDAFCTLADAMRLKGRKYYSARAVMEVVRWHRHLKDSVDVEFKINNNHTPRMAHTYNRLHGIDFFRERHR